MTNQSQQLNTLRALAAIYVVLHHLFRHVDGIGLIFSFGQEAVIIFFLLSGRVISISEKKSRKNASCFYLARLKRIYPPLILTLVITLIMYQLNLIKATCSISSLLGTLFAMQDLSSLKPGVITDPFLGNAPLWSLSYEIYFYFSYPLIRAASEKYKNIAAHLVPSISCVGISTYLLIPNHFSLVNAYMIIWWIGAITYQNNTKINQSNFYLKTLIVIQVFIGFYIFEKK